MSERIELTRELLDAWYGQLDQRAHDMRQIGSPEGDRAAEILEGIRTSIACLMRARWMLEAKVTDARADATGA